MAKSIKIIGPYLFCCVLFLSAWPVPVPARINLMSLPPRGDVVIRLTGENEALVQEHRVLSLNKGVNRVDFSWRNVSIDPDSILLETPSAPSRVRLLSLSYPPGEAALVWEIFSDASREQAVVISYLLSGIDRLVAYQITADPKETQLHLDVRLVLRNFSGENFDSAVAWLDGGTRFPVSASHLETRRILFFEKDKIPARKKLLWDGAAMPHDPKSPGRAVGIPMGYELENTAAAGLGTVDMAKGKVRMFQQDKDGTTIFSGEQHLDFLPRGGKAFLTVGESLDVTVSKHRMSVEKTGIKKNDKDRVVVYDEIVTDRYEIENTTDQGVALTLIDRIPGQWEPLDMGCDYTLKDYRTLAFALALKPGEKRRFRLTYKIRNIFAAAGLMRD